MKYHLYNNSNIVCMLWAINYSSGFSFFTCSVMDLLNQIHELQCPWESRVYGEWVAGTLYNRIVHVISGWSVSFFVSFNLDILGEIKHTWKLNLASGTPGCNFWTKSITKITSNLKNGYFCIQIREAFLHSNILLA